jgi:hypothetical protein
MGIPIDDCLKGDIEALVLFPMQSSRDWISVAYRLYYTGSHFSLCRPQKAD